MVAKKGKTVLRLYVSGNSPYSERAKRNLESLCVRHLKGRVQMEVIDVQRDPARMFQDGILVIPTLMKIAPKPEGVIVGDLSDESAVLSLLTST